MTTNNVEKLLERALRAFRQRKFILAEKYWTQASTLRPDDARIICNLGMAKTELGAFDQALGCFAEAIKKNSRCARAYNNQAALLAQIGAPLDVVLPPFILALELSESYEDFGRHAINVCHTVAFAFDPTKSLLFDEMEKHVLAVSQRFKPQTATAAEKVAIFWPRFIAAYRQVATYRISLAEKRWNDADRALNQAVETFAAISMDRFADDLRAHRKIFDFAKAIYAFLEEIGSIPNTTPGTAFERGKELHRQGVMVLQELESPPNNPLLDTLGWFTTLVTSQFGFLSGEIADRPEIEQKSQLLIWLSSGAFRKIGNEFITILNFVDQRLQSYSDSSKTIASTSSLARLRDDEWTRIALFVNGQVLGFADIEAAVARSTLRWNSDPMQKIRMELHDFRAFVERQAYRDIFVRGQPMENIARTLLQARLSARSYREVPTRGGRSDILAFVGAGARVLIETKIWRGGDYHEAGIRELGEYVIGEKDDHALLGIFYVVFDPTEAQSAQMHEGGPIAMRTVEGVSLEVLTISLRPPTPSRKP